MSQHTISPEITHAPEHTGVRAEYGKYSGCLSVITLMELGLGMAIYTVHKGANPNANLVLLFKGDRVCILTLAKAYYIVSVFMHLGDEIRNMIMTIIVPLMLFIWFIIAFLWDGNSWRNLRNTDAGSRPNIEKVQQPVKAGAKE